MKQSGFHQGFWGFTQDSSGILCPFIRNGRHSSSTDPLPQFGIFFLGGIHPSPNLSNCCCCVVWLHPDPSGMVDIFHHPSEKPTRYPNLRSFFWDPFFGIHPVPKLLNCCWMCRLASSGSIRNGRHFPLPKWKTDPLPQFGILIFWGDPSSTQIVKLLLDVSLAFVKSIDDVCLTLDVTNDVT